MASLFTELFRALPDSPAATAILFLGSASFLLLIARPSCMFNESGEFKAFGTRSSETLVPFWMAILLAGLLGYYLAFGLELTR